MLPNGFAGGFYRSFDCLVNALCGIGLHSRHHVTVEIERDPDGRMAEAFAGDLQMRTNSAVNGEIAQLDAVAPPFPESRLAPLAGLTISDQQR